MLDRVESSGESWRLGAGLPGPLAARRTAEAGWAGLHKFVGVPGTVGGGVYMNAGCHGGEWAEVVTRVLVVDAQGQERWLMRADVPFTYRRSGLDGLVVLEADVTLRAERKEALAEEVAELFRWRQEGTPFNQPCCGSVFKNPGGPSWEHREGPRTAGQLIEAAGPQGVAHRWRGNFSNARELFREHRGRIGRRRSGPDCAGAARACTTSSVRPWKRK